MTPAPTDPGPRADPAPPGGAERRTISLPSEVVRALERRMQGTSFESVDGFVTFVLERLLEQPGEGPFSAEDERLLRDRLRSLGYID